MGTLGAIIKLRSLPEQGINFATNGVLYLWFVLTCLILLIGLQISQNDLHIMMTSEEYEQLSQRYGENICIDDDDPLILQMLGRAVFAEPLSPYATLHPIAFAGWVGCH